MNCQYILINIVLYKPFYILIRQIEYQNYKATQQYTFKHIGDTHFKHLVRRSIIEAVWCGCKREHKFPELSHKQACLFIFQKYLAAYVPAHR